MSDKEAILILLKIHCLSEGADLCDKCEDVIWPEIELVRCDPCVGRHGPPDPATVRKAETRHRERIAAHERELREDFCHETP